MSKLSLTHCGWIVSRRRRLIVVCGHSWGRITWITGHWSLILGLNRS